MTQRHITKFNNTQQYEQDFDNLDFPNVSYIDDGDEVRYMESHPWLIKGKSTYTSPFELAINGTGRTVTLDPNTGDWKLNVKPYLPLTSLYRFINYNNFNSKMKEVNFSKMLDTSNVTDFESAFEYCYGLTTLGIPQIGNGTKRVSTTFMFSNCSKLANIPSCGAIHNNVSFSASPLTLDSAKVILNALSTPYSGNQTLTFSSTTKGYVNADSEALAIVAEKQAMGWTIAL